MTPTGWIEAGEHLPPLAGWRARRVVSGELEVEAPGGARHVLGSRAQWARVLGPAHAGHPVPELVEALVEAEEDRLADAAAAEEDRRRAARRRSVAAYEALAAADRKKRDPHGEKGGTG